MRANAQQFAFPLDFDGVQLAGSPNQYLVLPAGSQERGQHAESPRFDVPHHELRQAWLYVAESEPRVVSTNQDAETDQHEFVQRSRVFGFPDIITVQFVSTEETGSTLAVYSRSKYGRGDLGVNRRRIQRWLDLVSDRLAIE